MSDTEEGSDFSADSGDDSESSIESTDESDSITESEDEEQTQKISKRNKKERVESQARNDMPSTHVPCEQQHGYECNSRSNTEVMNALTMMNTDLSNLIDKAATLKQEFITWCENPLLSSTMSSDIHFPTAEKETVFRTDDSEIQIPVQTVEDVLRLDKMLENEHVNAQVVNSLHNYR